MNRINRWVHESGLAGGYAALLTGILLGIALSSTSLHDLRMVIFNWQSLIAGAFAVLAALIGAQALHKSTQKSIAIQMHLHADKERKELGPLIHKLLEATMAFEIASFATTPKCKELVNGINIAPSLSARALDLRKAIDALRGKIGVNFETAATFCSSVLAVAEHSPDENVWYDFISTPPNEQHRAYARGLYGIREMSKWALDISNGAPIADMPQSLN